VTVQAETGWPDEGNLVLSIATAPSRPWDLAVRVPPWNTGPAVQVAGAGAPAGTATLAVAGQRVTSLMLPGLAAAGERGTEWPYRAGQHRPAPARVPLRAIPYYAWANRGASEMRVWIPESP
jgi:DUF1680 family protein